MHGQQNIKIPSVILNILTYVVRMKLLICNEIILFNLSNPTGHVTHHQFNILQLYALPTLYLCVLYLSPNKQLLLTHTI